MTTDISNFLDLNIDSKILSQSIGVKTEEDLGNIVSVMNNVNNDFTSLCFLVKYLNNYYIIFPYHEFSKKGFIVSYVFSESTAYFQVIGFDIPTDLGVAIFLKNDPRNKDVNFNTTIPFTLTKVIPSFKQNETFNFFNYSKELNLAIDSTQISTFNFNGPQDMLHFLFPKSVLLENFVNTGNTGSPLFKKINNNYVVVGMITSICVEFNNYKDQVFCASGDYIHNLFFKIVTNYIFNLPSLYLPNGFINIKNTEEFLSAGIPRNYLGIMGFDVNNLEVFNINIYRLLQNTKGYAVIGFYTYYDSIGDMFSLNKEYSSDANINTKYNYKIPVVSPFVNSKMYERFYTSFYQLIILNSLTYTNEDGIVVTIDFDKKESISDYYYFGDPTKNIGVIYTYFDTATKSFVRITTPEVIFVTNNQRNIFPKFVLGKENTNGYNFNLNGKRYDTIYDDNDDNDNMNNENNIDKNKDKDIDKDVNENKEKK